MEKSTDKKSTKDTTPIPVPKPTKKGPEHFATKDYVEGDLVRLQAEVNGIPKGTRGLVDKIQFGGAVFFVKVLEGLKADEVHRIKADDLERIRTKAKLEKDKEALKELVK